MITRNYINPFTAASSFLFVFILIAIIILVANSRKHNVVLWLIASLGGYFGILLFRYFLYFILRFSIGRLPYSFSNVPYTLLNLAPYAYEIILLIMVLVLPGKNGNYSKSFVIKNCPQCGYYVKPEMKFCPYCGAKLTNEEQ